MHIQLTAKSMMTLEYQQFTPTTIAISMSYSTIFKCLAYISRTCFVKAQVLLPIFHILPNVMYLPAFHLF